MDVTVPAELFCDGSRHEQLAELGVERVLAHPWLGRRPAAAIDAALAFIESLAANRTEVGLA